MCACCPRALDPPKLELTKLVSCCVDVTKWTQVICKRAQVLFTPSHVVTHIPLLTVKESELSIGWCLGRSFCNKVENNTVYSWFLDFIGKRLFLFSCVLNGSLFVTETNLIFKVLPPPSILGVLTLSITPSVKDHFTD